MKKFQSPFLLAVLVVALFFGGCLDQQHYEYSRPPTTIPTHPDDAGIYDVWIENNTMSHPLSMCRQQSVQSPSSSITRTPESFIILSYIDRETGKYHSIPGDL